MSRANTTSAGKPGPKADSEGGKGDAAVVGDEEAEDDPAAEPVNSGGGTAFSASRPFLEGLAAYYRTVQESWRREDVEQRAADAYAAVLEALQGTDVAEVQQRALRGAKEPDGEDP